MLQLKNLLFFVFENFFIGENKMEAFKEYLAKINNPQNREQLKKVLEWVNINFTNLTPKIAWNQPMFTDHGTFIIGFSVAKNHFSIAPEKAGIEHFSNEIEQAGYEYSKELIRIPWNSPVDYLLIEKIIIFNILDKANFATFWRK
jgi:uncharacterized protein YdhG (YjbR/CyaY superfamily)